MHYLLDLTELSKTFQSQELETTALDGVHLKIRSGDFVAIMGPSGCGKSTLLNMLGLLDRPNTGSYLFNGKSAFPASDKQRDELVREGIGFVFQQFNLIDDLNIFDNVQLPLYYKKWTAKKRKDRVNQVLDDMGIGHRASHKPQQLSGGQQQRAALARAIAGDPLLILADEPTGNLDSKNGIQVMELLTKLNEEGKTIIMVTHSDRDAAYAHRIINMADGRLNDLAV